MRLFSVKIGILTFLTQTCRNIDSGLKIIIKKNYQKTNVGIGIIIFKIPCVTVSRLNGQLRHFLAQIFPKIDLGLETQKTNVGIRISILEILCIPLFRQSRKLLIFPPKFGETAQLHMIFCF